MREMKRNGSCSNDKPGPGLTQTILVLGKI